MPGISRDGNGDPPSSGRRGDPRRGESEVEEVDEDADEEGEEEAANQLEAIRSGSLPLMDL